MTVCVDLVPTKAVEVMLTNNRRLISNQADILRTKKCEIVYYSLKVLIIPNPLMSHYKFCLMNPLSTHCSLFCELCFSSPL